MIAVTGSVGKTSTKDLITRADRAAPRASRRTRANFNTEIGLPLAILGAPLGTQVMVLEMGMRGFGQIAELAAIAEPDVGVITNIGPVHLEQMGSLEGVAQAKAELLVGLHDGATAVVPGRRAAAGAVAARVAEGRDVRAGGDVCFEGSSLRGGTVPDAPPSQHVVLAGASGSSSSCRSTRPTTAATRSPRSPRRARSGSTPGGRLDVRFSGLRGERVLLGTGATVINDCYNANPLSMRAALDDLATHETTGRPRSRCSGTCSSSARPRTTHHRDVGAYAADRRASTCW